METINTVNFEDLFDFSPEPVDQVASGGSGERGSSKPTDIRARAATISSSGGRYEQHQQQHLDAFADFDRAVLAGGSAYLTNRSNNLEVATDSVKLSASVPANWNSSGGGISSAATTTTASSSADTKAGNGSSFIAAQSVGQLLSELPRVAGEEDQTAAVASSLPSAAAASVPAPVVVKSKRGRKPGQKSLRTDMKTKLERSRQSARECRARKKLRYQYLDDIILEREKANELIRQELVKYQKWCHELDKGRIPDGLENMLKEFKAEQQQQQQQQQQLLQQTS